MNTNPHDQQLHERWRLEGRIPLAQTAPGAQWIRAHSLSTGEPCALFVVHGETALETADAARRAFLVEDPHLMPIVDVVVLDDPREKGQGADGASSVVPSTPGVTSAPEQGSSPQDSSGDSAPAPTTVVVYPMPTVPPLAALLSKGPLRPETARSVIGEAAMGLEAARRRGVRHQFLDSNRVFVDLEAGTVQVLGVGVEAASHPGLDRSGAVASFHDTSALVALLYRALTGRAPRQSEDGEVPRASTIAPRSVPQDLDVLCDAVLNERETMPETARELVAELEPWQSIPVTLEAYDPQDQTKNQRPTVSPDTNTTHSSRTARSVTTSAAVAAGSVGVAGVAGVTGAAGVAPANTTAEAAVLPSGADDTVPTATQHQTDETSPAQAEGDISPEAHERNAAQARELVEDLHLDQKRETSSFPTSLDMTLPRQAAPTSSAASEPSEPSAVEEASAPLAPAVPAAPAAPTASEAPAEAPASSASAPSAPAVQQEPTPPAAPRATSRTRSATGPVPVLVPGRAEPVSISGPVQVGATPVSPSDAADSPAASSGPIVVQGRSRSSLDTDAPETSASNGSWSRGSLLRDVVSVATDSDTTGGTFAMGPQEPEARSRQSQWILIGAALVVIAALIFAVTSITSGLRDRVENPLATTKATPAPSDSPVPEEANTSQPPQTSKPALPAPKVASIEGFELNAPDPVDNADQIPRITDGDPGTFWSTKHYSRSTFGGLKEAVGLRIKFAEKSMLTTLVVTTARNTGGTMDLHTINADGTPGEIIATGSFAGDGEVRLKPDKPVETVGVILMIKDLPPDSKENGRFRARIAEIRAE